LTANLEERRLGTVIPPAEFLQAVMLPGISQEGLLALVRLVTNSMTVTDLELRKGLNLTNANLNLSNMANGTSLL
jgi:hypothetical protein